MGRALPLWALAVMAGLIFPLGLAPFYLWLAIPVSAGLLYWSLNKTPTLSSWRVGWVYGCGFFGASVSWVYVSIRIYGNSEIWLAASLTIFFCISLAILFALQSLLFKHLCSRNRGFAVAQFSSLWVLFEWIRSWLLTGFPWAFAGYGALDSPLAGWIPILGVYGCSWLLVALGCMWIELISQIPPKIRWIKTGIITSALLVFGVYLKHIPWTQPAGSPIATAVIQPNIPLERKWDRHFRGEILEKFAKTSQELYKNHMLVVWPESAIPVYRDQISNYVEQLDATAQSERATIITGIPTRQDSDRFNSIEALGNGKGIYHKQKLVPFGEYVPLEFWLRGLISFFDLPMSNFSSGSSTQEMLKTGSITLAPFICYEIVYPDFVLQSGRGADLLVTISNDTWFGDSAGPWQHFQMARFRAAELGRDLIRATNDGVSALVDHHGHVKATASQFTESVVSGTVQPRNGLTLFARTGSWPVLTMCIATLLFGRRYA